VSGKSIPPTFRDPADFWAQYAVLFDGPRPLSRERVIEEVYKSAIGSNAKARAAFGWRPELDLVAGVQSVYADAVRRFGASAKTSNGI